MLAYFIGMLLCILCILFMLGCVDSRAYIIHILLLVSAFVPIWNFIAFSIFIITVAIIIPIGEVELKRNKITKFLFGIDEEE